MTAPVVAANRYPTVVVGPDGARLSAARTVVTCPALDPETLAEIEPARLMVWSSPGAPLVDAAIDRAASTIGRPRDTWTVVTSAGQYRVEPGRGCGCGHPLRRYEPFSPMIMGTLPT